MEPAQLLAALLPAGAGAAGALGVEPRHLLAAWVPAGVGVRAVS